MGNYANQNKGVASAAKQEYVSSAICVYLTMEKLHGSCSKYTTLVSNFELVIRFKV